MQTKRHYKLYKSGKLWMTAMVSVTVLGVASIAYADTNAVSATPSDSINVTADNTNTQTTTLHTNQATTDDNNDGATSATLPQASVPTEEKTVAPIQENGANLTTNDSAQRAQELVVYTVKNPEVNSQITVSNPTDYPTKAAQLVGKNQQGQPYYVYQIVNLTNTKINNRQARLILSVDPAAPQGANYLYVTTDQYDRA